MVFLKRVAQFLFFFISMSTTNALEVMDRQEQIITEFCQENVPMDFLVPGCVEGIDELVNKINEVPA